MQKPEIDNWAQFRDIVRPQGCQLLRRLSDFPNSVLVAGCQRSGTTMLARIITQSEGMVNYWGERDDELEAALILSGQIAHSPRGRYCFQTTYLNNCYREYYEHLSSGFKLIWVIRNPFSVVFSMLNNWVPWALDDLFLSCGKAQLRGFDRWRYALFGLSGVSPLRRACYSYLGKTSQLLELRAQLPDQNMIVVDYDDLVSHKRELLPEIYRFIKLPYRAEYSETIHSESLKKSSELSDRELSRVRSTCSDGYMQSRKYRLQPALEAQTVTQEQRILSRSSRMST